MTPEELVEDSGIVVTAGALTTAKAKQLVDYVNTHPVARISVEETRRSAGHDALVVELRAAIGQTPKNDIRRSERLLIVFGAADVNWPQVYPLRADFPTRLPHLNVPEYGFPPTLCLSELPYEDAKRVWTPAYYVNLLHNWLEASARNDLQQTDQELEPFLLHSGGTLIVPHRLLSADPDMSEGPFAVYIVAERVFQLLSAAQVPNGRPVNLLFLDAPARVHGGLPSVPSNLAQLVALLASDEFRPMDKIRNGLKTLHLNRAMRECPFILVLRVPLIVEVGSEVSRHDVQAFITDKNLHEIGVSLDLWDAKQPDATIISPDQGRDGSDIPMLSLNVNASLSQTAAAEYNGVAPPDKRLIAIGTGALGSQVLANLARGGWTPAAVVDKDVFLPHNLARHALLSDSIGSPKASSLRKVLSTIADDAPEIRALIEDVLHPAKSVEELGTADVILDVSASTSVAAFLALESPARGRRISLYLNPSGTDLVVLGEDTERRSRLDHLEMQYYWNVATAESLHKHLVRDRKRRYGQGCRDVSAQIKQTSVAVHSGIGAEALRRLVASTTSSAVVWQLDEELGTVSRTELDARPMRQLEANGWNVLISEALVEQLRNFRERKLPDETGGVLIGSFDMKHHLVYLVGTIPAPPDSKEWPTGYIRGFLGLRKTVEDIAARTSGHLEYAGEWHSHPNRSTEPSEADRSAYAKLASQMGDDGHPASMLIVGAESIRCLLLTEEIVLRLVA